ncbi:trypsin-like peptidase domain-containing protein [Salinarchaeum chitinilyticum]
MTRRRYYAAAIAALTLLVVAGLVAPSLGVGTSAVAPTAPADDDASTTDDPLEADGALLQQQQADGACNYTELYDETIDAVVTVQRGGGQGSGFVTQIGANDSTQYVVTNAHVVGDAANVTIQFDRGESSTGQVVGTDVSSDLAAVRVTDAPDYVEALSLTNESLEHGQHVAALGSPFGLEATITHGIVSGLDRSLPTNRGYTIPNVIQTDAPISSGNSGGPLLTCQGTVAGVNTAGIAAQGAENIGFAVPASTVELVVPSLVQNGTFTHPTLGVSGVSVTPAIAEANDLDVTGGFIVATVDQSAPAASVLQGSDQQVQVAGQVVPVGGDVIVAVEGQQVANREDIASVLLAETRPGEEVDLTIVRDGQEMNVTTTVVERPEPEPVAP